MKKLIISLLITLATAFMLQSCATSNCDCGFAQIDSEDTEVLS